MRITAKETRRKSTLWWYRSTPERGKDSGVKMGTLFHCYDDGVGAKRPLCKRHLKKTEFNEAFDFEVLEEAEQRQNQIAFCPKCKSEYQNAK